MKRLLRFLVFLVLLLAGGLYLLTLVDLGRFAPQIEAAAEKATGRVLKINGPLHIGFSLQPSVVAEQVSFANAPWGSRPQMVKAEKLELSMSLLPLLSGEVDIHRVALKGADIYLETNRKGDGNWVFGEAARAEDKTAGESGMSLARLPELDISDFRLSYRDGKTGQVSEAALSEVTLKPSGDAYHAIIKGDVNGAALSFAADLSGDTQKISLANATLTLAGTTIGGDLALDLTGRPRFTGALGGSTFDATPFLKGSNKAGGGGKGAGALFSKEPLPLDALTAADAEIALTLGELRYGNVLLSSLKLPLKLNSGKLSAPLSAQYRGVPVSLALSADGASGRVSVDAKSAGFDLGKLLADLDLTTMLDARADFGAKLNGRGKSLHAIAASLSGQTNLAIGKGTINSRAFSIVSDDLVKVLIPNGESGDTARLSCAISRFDFQNGVGRASALALETSGLVTTGSGTVDLGKERVDLLFRPRPKNPSLVSLAFPVRLSGPLTSPSAGLDRTGVVTGVATAVGGVALTGGVGALLPLMSSGSGSVATDGDCAAAAKESSGIAGTVGGAAEGVARGVGDAVEGIGKGIGRGLQGIFGN